MKTNIMFIIPPVLPISEIETFGLLKYEAYIPTSIPLGILSIAAYLSKHSNVNIRIIDFNILLSKETQQNKSFNDIMLEHFSEISKEFTPKFIGISALFNSTFSYLDRISKSAKEYYPNATIFAGGGLPTNLYSSVLEEAPSIDAICYGEGEIPILELIQAIDSTAHLSGSNCWLTRDKDIANAIPEAKFIMDLDDIPPFDYSLIDFDDYQKNSRYHGDENGYVMSMMTSRGCPFFCCFCATHTVHGRSIRLMSSERILNDVDILINKYEVKTFCIEDDHFLINKKRALEVLAGLSSRNVNIEFTNGLAVYAIDEDIAIALKLAGVKMVTLAVESGSERVLNEIIHKPLKLSNVGVVVSLLRKSDIYVRAFFIIGFPGETEEDREMTVNFIRNTGFSWVGVLIATPIAGSELYDICSKNNYLVSHNIEDFHFGKANIKTEDFTPEYIQAKRYHMNLEINFVNNYDLLNGNYKIALIGFSDVIKRVKTHAFAYYYAAICYDKLLDFYRRDYCMNMYRSIIKSDVTWKDYAIQFGLEV